MSVRYFTPGRTGTTVRVKDLYVLNDPYCFCLKTKQYKLNEQIIIQNVSNNFRVSQILNSSLGGKSVYVNNLNNVNQFGRLEGQSGGSGSPLRNKF